MLQAEDQWARRNARSEKNLNHLNPRRRSIARTRARRRPREGEEGVCGVGGVSAALATSCAALRAVRDWAVEVLWCGGVVVDMDPCVQRVCLIAIMIAQSWLHRDA